MARVWIQNWYSVSIEETVRNMRGGKPMRASGR